MIKTNTLGTRSECAAFPPKHHLQVSRGSVHQVSPHRSVRDEQLGDEIPIRSAGLHWGDQNSLAARVGDFKMYIRGDRCLSGEFARTTKNFQKQGSSIQEFNSIRIFHETKVIADMKVIESH